MDAKKKVLLQFKRFNPGPLETPVLLPFLMPWKLKLICFTTF